MESEAIGSAAAVVAAAMGAAGDFPPDPVRSLPIFQSGASPSGSVHDEGSEIEGWAADGLRDSSVAAHDSCDDPGGEGSRDGAPAESGESAVKPDSKGPGWIRRGGLLLLQTKKILVDGQLRKNTINLTKVYIIIGGFFGTVENMPFTKRSLRNDDGVKKTREVFDELGAKGPDSCLEFKYSESRIKNLMWTIAAMHYKFFWRRRQLRHHLSGQSL